MDGDYLFGCAQVFVVLVFMLVYLCAGPDPECSSSVDGQSNDSNSSYTSTSSHFQDELGVASLEPHYKLEAVVIDVDKVAEIAESCGECVICFESLSLDLEQRGGESGSGSEIGIKILGMCGHRYHAACIEQWLTKHRDCPLCRRYVPRSSRHERPSD